MKNISKLLLGFLISIVVVSLISIMIGRYSISPSDLINIITGKTSNIHDSSEIVLLKVRLPRILAALMIGGALSLSGASYQGIFKNPMVSPDILGASAGAGFGAALALLIGLKLIFIQLFSFAFGIIAVFLSYFISRSVNKYKDSTILLMVLTGMVVSALFTAMVSIIKYVADPYDTLPAITFWLMGGLNYVTLPDILVLVIPLIIGGVPLLIIRWHINILALGDEEANALGINAKKFRLIIILCATLLTSSSVAVGGMIGWIGLIIPHLARLKVGPDYRKLLPVSFMMGSLFLLVVDDIARCSLSQEIPLGILTAIIGAPFFLYLIYNRKKGFCEN